MSVADIWLYFRRGCRRAPAALRVWLSWRAVSLAIRLFDVADRLAPLELPDTLPPNPFRTAAPDPRLRLWMDEAYRDADTAINLAVAIAKNGHGGGQTA